LEGGVDSGESDLVGRPGESALGGGRRGPALSFDTSAVGEELLRDPEPVLSDRCIDKAVVCNSDVGVGLGVPLTLGSGLALEGGLGRGIREFLLLLALA